MGYFAETINAIYETKSEITSQNRLLSNSARATGDHEVSKYIRDNKAELRKKTDHALNGKPMRTAQDYKDREAYAKEVNKAVDKADKMPSSEYRSITRNSLKAEAFDFSSVPV